MFNPSRNSPHQHRLRLLSQAHRASGSWFCNLSFRLGCRRGPAFIEVIVPDQLHHKIWALGTHHSWYDILEMGNKTVLKIGQIFCLAKILDNNGPAYHAILSSETMHPQCILERDKSSSPNLPDQLLSVQLSRILRRNIVVLRLRLLIPDMLDASDNSRIKTP